MKSIASSFFFASSFQLAQDTLHCEVSHQSFVSLSGSLLCFAAFTSASELF